MPASRNTKSRWLPEQREITNVLAGLWRLLAQQDDTDRFSPRDDNPQTGAASQPVEVEVTATLPTSAIL
jgi:hypothetical protein